MTAVDNCVRQVKANADVTVGKNRAVFYHGSIIDIAVAFNIGTPGNQALCCDPTSAADESWRNNSSVSVDLSSLIHPNARANFAALRTQATTGSEAVDGELAQVGWALKPIDVATHKILGWFIPM